LSSSAHPRNTSPEEQQEQQCCEKNAGQRALPGCCSRI
jgi:hypothetical protein